eukprot:TRINITY_DN11674_c0_g1_i1.p1 TRINITY_DN11674_c0_g1~~TRINITY_DN11674_c0_g1_i1.p1  ORF type:complete len:253 (-),score=70.23 TRINITY_DN11674_c0_g1_i1:8-766(-)
MIKNGVETCSPLELRQLLKGEGIPESTIACLENNKIGGSLLLSLDSGTMRNDLKLIMKERLRLKHVIKCWKKKEMADDEGWSTDKVIQWFSQFKFLHAGFTPYIQKIQMDGRMFLELESNDLKDLGIGALADRIEVMNKLSEEVRIKDKESDALKQLEVVAEWKETEKKSKQIPDVFLCPITQEIMKEPVMASDGHTYEKEAIEEWFGRKKRKSTSPLTGAPLKDRKLVPNYGIKKMIQSFHDENNNNQHKA